MPLWAVHISDGVLATPFWLAGFAAAILLLCWGAWKTQEEEVPRIALATAVFFIASTIHIKVPGSSVHLLLNGLTGVVLGRRAVLAIAGGLVLQALLIGHGGFYALGVNICVMTLPALAACVVHRALVSGLTTSRRVICSLLVFAAAAMLTLSSVFSGAMLSRLLTDSSEWIDKLQAAWEFTVQPVSLVITGILAVAATIVERRVHATPFFALGFFLGSLTVLLTSALNCIVLLVGGDTVWPMAPWAMVVLHLPVAALEGLIMGVTVAFLRKVKPELLGAEVAAIEPAAENAVLAGVFGPPQFSEPGLNGKTGLTLTSPAETPLPATPPTVPNPG